MKDSSVVDSDYHKRYYLKHKEKINQNSLKYYYQHKDEILKRQHQKYLQKKGGDINKHEHLQKKRGDGKMLIMILSL